MLMIFKKYYLSLYVNYFFNYIFKNILFNLAGRIMVNYYSILMREGVFKTLYV